MSIGRPSTVKFMLRALRYRNYRLFFGGQIVSLAGIVDHDDCHELARLPAHRIGAPARRSSASPASFRRSCSGRSRASSSIASIAIGCSSVTQTISMLQSFALAALTLSGHITVPLILALSIVQGIVNAFDMPARQAFLIDDDREQGRSGNAIALNSSMVNVARLLGPSIAGVRDRGDQRRLVLPASTA